MDADDATIEVAVRLARGSARDALSALDQLVATGSPIQTQPQFDGLFHALIDEDAVQALKSLALLRQGGWTPSNWPRASRAKCARYFFSRLPRRG